MAIQWLDGGKNIIAGGDQAIQEIIFDGDGVSLTGDSRVATAAENAATTQAVNAQWVRRHINNLNLGGGGAEVWFDENPPASPTKGQMWWQPSQVLLRIWDNTLTPHAWIGIAYGGGGPGGQVSSVNPLVTATGNDQASAKVLDAQLNYVTHGGGHGVRWQPGKTGDSCYVYNSTDEAVLFYPPTGGSLNSESDAFWYIQPRTTGSFKAVTLSRIVVV